MVTTRARKALADDLEKKAQQERQLKSVAGSPLFKLPPELRNMIYRYAIVSNRTLRVTKSRGIPEAPLLSVNKLIRAETFGLFYADNKFKCIVRSYDPAPLKLVHRKLSRVSVKLLRHVCTELHVSGTPNWENLVVWFHSAHQGVCCGFFQTLMTLGRAWCWDCSRML
jgi:hypothetical protein